MITINHLITSGNIGPLRMQYADFPSERIWGFDVLQSAFEPHTIRLIVTYRIALEWLVAQNRSTHLKDNS